MNQTKRGFDEFGARLLALNAAIELARQADKRLEPLAQATAALGECREPLNREALRRLHAAIEAAH